MAQQIQFGHWRFDPDSNRLVNRATECKLQPRVARLLEYFLENADQVHSHDHLIRAVWDGRIVSDDAVRRAVSSLRRALALDGSDRFIKTISRKGYRAHFPAPAPDAGASGPDTESQEQPRSWHTLVARRGRHLVWTTALLLFLALVLWAVMGPRGHRNATAGIASTSALTTSSCVSASPFQQARQSGMVSSPREVNHDHATASC